MVGGGFLADHESLLESVVHGNQPERFLDSVVTVQVDKSVEVGDLRSGEL